MKKVFSCLFLLPALLFASCNRMEPLEREFTLNFNIGNYPSYPQTKDIGTPDPGKSSWEENDCVYIMLMTESSNVLGPYRLTYVDGGWNKLEKYSAGDYSVVSGITISEPSMAAVIYAPGQEYNGNRFVVRQGRKLGLDEYFEWMSSESEFNVTDDTVLDIEFARKYSRIRVSADEGCTVTLTADNFCPASTGSQFEETTMTATVNSDGNAFFYGQWKAGSSITVSSKDANEDVVASKTLENRPVSVVGKSYAIDCKQKYTTVAELCARAGSSMIIFTDEVVKNVIITYVSGSYVYMEDETAGIVLYSSGHGLKAGDCLNGPISGTLILYDGSNPAKNPSMAYAEMSTLDYSKARRTTGVEIPVTEVTVADYLANPFKYYNRRAVIKDVLVTGGISKTTQKGEIVQNGDKANIFNKDKKASISAGKKGDLVCYPSYHYKDGLELLVYLTSDFTEKTIPAENNAFTNETVAGIYDISSLESSNTYSAIRTVAGYDQKGFFKSVSLSSFRIQNFSSSEVYIIGVKTSAFSNQESFDYDFLSFTSGALEKFSSEVTVMKTTDTKVWLKDLTKNRGYIFDLN